MNLTSQSRVSQGRLPCPKCPSSDGYHLYTDGHGYCYSCKYFKPKEGEEFFVDDIYTYEYLPHRGLFKKTLEFYDIKTKVDKDGKPVSVGFKYPSGRIKVRSLARKEFHWTAKGEHNVTAREDQLGSVQASSIPAERAEGLFGREHFSAGEHKNIIITEGEYDAATWFQILGVPSVSVRSSSSAVTDITVDRSFVNAHERIYLSFDADAAGRQALRDCARLFDYNKLRILGLGQMDGDVLLKDANDYLKAGKADDLRNIYANAKRYLPETVVSINKDTIAEILAEAPADGVPYPPSMATLNKMTRGIHRGRSVLVTAKTGVGKTELMHALEHQLLESTNDNIGAIYLEEPKADHLRSLASIELGRPCFHSDSGVSTEEVVSAVQKAAKVDDRLHVYSHFGCDDPEVFLDTIRFLVSACNVVYVLVDHISMVVSGIRGTDDERRALDYIVTRLEMMIKELNFSLIFVSHVNDFGDTRGSRAIGQLADVRIDATRDYMNPDTTVKNTLCLSISKNRVPGTQTGEAGQYLFDPYTRRYSEIADVRHPDLQEFLPRNQDERSSPKRGRQKVDV